MRRNLSKLLLAGLTLFVLSCVQNKQGQIIYSPYPVSLNISQNLKGSVEIKNVKVAEEGKNYVVQIELKNNSESYKNLLYRVLLFNQKGLKIDYPTLGWTAASIAPGDTLYLKVVVPKSVGKISKVEIDLKSPEGV